MARLVKLAPFLFVVLAAGFVLQIPHRPAKAHPSTVQRNPKQLLVNLPAYFEPNQGQAGAGIDFLSHGLDCDFYLEGPNAVLALKNKKGQSGDVLEAAVVGGREVRAEGIRQLPGVSNYYLGSKPSGWHTHVPQFAKVRYRDIYPGIDLCYYGNQGKLEYDFVVKPGADPKTIRLALNGADKLTQDGRGNLSIDLPHGQISFHAPVVYQEAPFGQLKVAGSFTVEGGQVSFQVAGYDRSRELVIDPQLLYSTYLGGGGDDEAYAIAIGGAGNAYVTGSTTSVNLLGSAQPSGDTFMFVAEIDPTGTSLIYHSAFGGTTDTTGGSTNVYSQGNAIALDGGGNAYIAGSTAANNYPTTAGVVQTSFLGGIQNGFVTKVDASGNLSYSTYLGAQSSDNSSTDANGIAVESGGTAYIVGSTNSFAYLTTTSAAQVAFSGPALATAGDVFLTKLDPNANSLLYSTYWGGAQITLTKGDDRAYGVAIDGTGKAYVVGRTNGNFPITGPAFQPSISKFAGNRYSAFLAAFDTTLSGGSSILFSSYLAGKNQDSAYGVALDASGNIYVSGETNSVDFPAATIPVGFTPVMTPGGATGTTVDPTDAFVVKINPTPQVVWASLIGGTSQDGARGIAVDASGRCFVTGYSDSTAGILQAPTPFVATQAAFVGQLENTGTVDFAQILAGGSGTIQIGQGIAIDAISDIHIAGYTNATDFPISPTAGVSPVQTFYGGGNEDAFVLALRHYDTNTITPTFSVSATFSPSSTISPTFTVSPTATPTFSVSQTFTISPTPSDSPTQSVSPTWSSSDTASATQTQSPTSSESPSWTPTATDTATSSVTPTVTATSTMMPSQTGTTSPTASPSSTSFPSTTPDLYSGPAGSVAVVYPVPNPNPDYLTFRLTGPSRVSLKFYSRAFNLVLAFETPLEPVGWVMVPIPSELRSKAKGTYYVVAQGDSGGRTRPQKVVFIK
jgi:hypothetical protein